MYPELDEAQPGRRVARESDERTDELAGVAADARRVRELNFPNES